MTVIVIKHRPKSKNKDMPTVVWAAADQHVFLYSCTLLGTHTHTHMKTHKYTQAQLQEYANTQQNTQA